MELLHEKRIFKTKKYISTKEISCKPHYGVENYEYNGKFDCILTKIFEPKDLILYKEIFEKMSEYKNTNDLSNFSTILIKVNY